MSALDALRRLLDLRQAEEDRSQLELDGAMETLRRLGVALTETEKRRSLARTRVSAGVETGQVIDRMAGVYEIAHADRLAGMILQKIHAGERDVLDRRQELLTRRLARRQVETIVNAHIAEIEMESNRKAQLELDDWHRTEKIRSRRRNS